MALAILGIGLGQAGISGQAGAGGQPGGLAAAAGAKPSAALFEYIVVTTMYRTATQKRRRDFIYTLFESMILEKSGGGVQRLHPDRGNHPSSSYGRC